MSRALRWSVFALVVVIAIVAVAAGSLPYLPLVHGSKADEIAGLVEWLDIRPGTHVADLGAGDGSYAIALADHVGPSGHVYATELSVERLEEIRAAAAGLGNVSAVEAAVSATNLPDACCDALFSRNVYHHLSDPAAINVDVYRTLRPGGRLLVIDFAPGSFMDFVSPPETAERHGGHGTPTATVVAEVTAAGFELRRGPEPWRGRLYAVLFEKPSAGAAP